MTFRKVDICTVECDGCGAHGPARRQPEDAEAAASVVEVPIRPLVHVRAGRHMCTDCRAEIAKGEAKR